MPKKWEEMTQAEKIEELHNDVKRIVTQLNQLEHATLNRLLPIGTKVRLRSDRPEFGVVVYCWKNEDIQGYYYCYVAFYGDEFPSGPPKQPPYVLRYAAVSLDVVSE